MNYRDWYERAKYISEQLNCSIEIALEMMKIELINERLNSIDSEINNIFMRMD